MSEQTQSDQSDSHTREVCEAIAFLYSEHLSEYLLGVLMEPDDEFVSRIDRVLHLRDAQGGSW